jgi:hypothetical protein
METQPASKTAYLLFNKIKGTVVPAHAINTYRGNTGTAPLILTLTSITFIPVPLRKKPHYPLKRRLGRLYRLDNSGCES